MSADLWPRLEEAFAQVIAKGAEGARGAVDEACAKDPELGPHLRAIVEAHFAPGSETASVHEVPAQLPALPKRFRVIAPLGYGAFGHVYRALDRESNVELAVKVLHARHAASLYYFKNEFRTLSQFHHVNVVTLYDGFFANEPRMFTMEYVDGVSVLAYIQQSTVEDRSERLRSCVAQLAEGVHALHENKFLHRDLKPSNVLVTAAGRVVLLDFGLVRDADVGSTQQASFVGTLAYMSPEQLTRGAATEASDWYAVGVMLYEMLTGAKPYETPWVSLEEKCPVAPARVNPLAPSDLSDLCVRLLAREPRDRASFPDFAAVGTVAAPAARASRTDRLFIGRRAELGQLAECYALSAEQPVVVHLSGPSGIGKTSSIRQCLGEIKSGNPSALVLAARCHQNESVPYPALDDLVDQLSRYLRHLSRDRVEQVLPRNFAALARMFPVLAEHRAGFHSLPARESAELRIRGFAALSEMLGRLAEQQRVVVAIDDLQWGDQEGCTFLANLMSSADAPRLMMVLAYRSEDLDANPWLRGLRRSEPRTSTAREVRLDLSSLSVPEATELARALLGPELTGNEPLPRQIAELSGGDPYVVHEIARWVNARGESALAEAISTADVIRSRIVGLSEDGHRLLELVAVAGQPTPLSDLQEACRFHNVLAARDELLRERLTRSRNLEGREEIEVYHDRIRAAVVQGLGAAELGQRHLELARAVQAKAIRDPERIANHLECAGEVAACGDYAQEAADRALEALAFEKAARFYHLALRAKTFSADDRCAVLRKLAEALASAGRCADAARAYTEAAALATRHQRLELTARAADQLLRGGYVREGLKVLGDVMSEVRLRPSRSRLTLLMRAGLLRARLKVRGLAFQERPECDLPEGDRLRLEVCWTGAMVTSLIDPLRSAECSARYVLLALRSGNPSHVATALACEAPKLCLTLSARSHAKARSLLETTRRLADRDGNPHTQARYLLSRSLVAYLQGDWHGASQDADASAELLRTKCVNVAWELTTAHIFGCAARFIRGEWAENRRRLPTLVRDLASRGDPNVAVSLRVQGCTYLLDLAADRPDQAARQLREDIAAWSYEHADFFRCNVVQAEIDIALYADDPMRAHEAIEGSWSRLERALLLRNPTTFAFLHFGRGRAALAMAEHVRDESRRRALVDRAESSARALQAKGPPWSAGMAAVLRSGVATWRADRDAVRRHLLEADRAFEAADIQPIRMAVAYHRARLHAEPDAGRLRNDVDEWARREGVVRLDRVVAALAPGQYASFSIRGSRDASS